MQLLHTFKRPENVDKRRWRFVLYWWAAGSAILAAAGVIGSIVTISVVLWFTLSDKAQTFGLQDRIIVALIPIFPLAFAAFAAWFCLSSLKSNRFT
jgi:hypothetical protein